MLAKTAGLTTQRDRARETNLRTIDNLTKAGNISALVNLQTAWKGDDIHSEEEDVINKSLTLLNAKRWAETPSTYEAGEAKKDDEILQKAISTAKRVLEK